MFKKNDVTDVVVKDVDTPDVDVDPGQYSRWGWMLVIFGFGGFLLWALFAPLDAGVPVSGTVTVSGNRKAVQHQNGGTIDTILVKEGDEVKAGQVLIRMNAVQSKSAADISRGQYYISRAMEARLLAELDNKATVTFPEDLLAAKSDPRAMEAIELQKQLFQSRRSALQMELGAVDESIAGIQSQLAGTKESRDNKKMQLDILKEQLTGLRELSRDGYIARNRLLEVERTFAQTNGAISEDVGNIGRLSRQMSELRLRRGQRQQEYQREVRSQLSDVQKEGKALAARLMSQDYDVMNTEVKAPVSGTVVNMSVFTNGGVIQSGVQLMEIVPTGEPWIVEGSVPVNLIDKVHAGLPVELIFSALNQNKTPHIPGIVTHVSADRTVDERTGVPFYKMKAKVAPEGVAMVAKLTVRPGMPAELFVKTGERNLMNYLLKPLTDRTKTALSED